MSKARRQPHQHSLDKVETTRERIVAMEANA